MLCGRAVLSNMVCKRRAVQDLVHSLGGAELLLMQCQVGCSRLSVYVAMLLCTLFGISEGCGYPADKSDCLRLLTAGNTP